MSKLYLLDALLSLCFPRSFIFFFFYFLPSYFHPIFFPSAPWIYFPWTILRYNQITRIPVCYIKRGGEKKGDGRERKKRQIVYLTRIDRQATEIVDLRRVWFVPLLLALLDPKWKTTTSTSITSRAFDFPFLQIKVDQSDSSHHFHYSQGPCFLLALNLLWEFFNRLHAGNKSRNGEGSQWRTENARMTLKAAGNFRNMAD